MTFKQNTNMHKKLDAKELQSKYASAKSLPSLKCNIGENQVTVNIKEGSLGPYSCLKNIEIHHQYIELI